MSGCDVTGDGIMNGSVNKNSDKNTRSNSVTPPSSDGHGDDPIEPESGGAPRRVSISPGPSTSTKPTTTTTPVKVTLTLERLTNISENSKPAEEVPITPRRLKGILKNKEEKSPLAPNALNYRGPDSNVKITDNNTEEDQRFSRVVDSKEIYRKRMAQKKSKYMKARYRSTDGLPISFRPKRRDDDDDPGNDPPHKQPPVTA